MLIATPADLAQWAEGRDRKELAAVAWRAAMRECIMIRNFPDAGRAWRQLAMFRALSSAWCATFGSDTEQGRAACEFSIEARSAAVYPPLEAALQAAATAVLTRPDDAEAAMVRAVDRCALGESAVADMRAVEADAQFVDNLGADAIARAPVSSDPKFLPAFRALVRSLPDEWAIWGRWLEARAEGSAPDPEFELRLCIILDADWPRAEVPLALAGE